MGNTQKKNAAARDINEREISVLSTTTGMIRGEVLEWHEKFLVEYPDGSIDKKEFIELYKRSYTHGNPEKFAQFAGCVNLNLKLRTIERYQITNANYDENIINYIFIDLVLMFIFIFYATLCNLFF
jgi:hypothetical protein